MVYKFMPTTRMNIERERLDSENNAARTQAMRLDNAIEENKQMWKDAQEAMSKYYNKKHKAMSYAPGDKVLLASKNIRMLRASKKLADRYLGPFEVLGAIGKNAYRLKLPAKYGRIHPTFHVSLLEPYHMREGCEPPEPIDIDGEDEWEVERVLDESMKRGKSRFLVRWKGYSEAHDSWEIVDHLENAQEKIKEYREI